MRKQQRFSSIPRFFSGCVYAVELTNGIVKVGFSRNPRTRMQALTFEAKRVYRCGVSRFHIGHDFDNSMQATRAELELIDRASKVGVAFRGRREYFVNLPFGVAANMVDQLSKRQYAHAYSMRAA